MSLVTVPLPEPPSSVTIIDFSGEEVETTAGPFQLDTVIRYWRQCCILSVCSVLSA